VTAPTPPAESRTLAERWAAMTSEERRADPLYRRTVGELGVAWVQELKARLTAEQAERLEKGAAA
jgi:hypothetical protein